MRASAIKASSIDHFGARRIGGYREAKRRGKNRSGNIVVLSALFMVTLIAMLAFAVDVGYIVKMRTDLTRSVDAAALAGAGNLVHGEDIAEEVAIEYLVRNPAGLDVEVTQANLETLISEFVAVHGEEIEIEMGHWDPEAVGPSGETGALVTGAERPSAVRVVMTHKDNPFFFSSIFGQSLFNVEAEAVAAYQPRDIMVAFDLSASMNDDSEFQAFGTLGQSQVEANQLECYQDLGSPVYGNGDLTFAPQWAEHETGQATAADPTITTTYKDTVLKVESSEVINTIRLRFSDYQYQTISNVNATDIDISGTGAHAGKRIYYAWIQAGDNDEVYGPNGVYHNWSPSGIYSKVKSWSGLDVEPYPYASGSWTDYINYCVSANNQNEDAGYRYQFGYMNMINYWFDRKPRNSQTADLWSVRAQPITAVKDSLDMFIDFIQEVDSDDHMGLSVYNGAGGDATKEMGLSVDLDAVGQIAQQRQAGHYHDFTNIGSGMEQSRVELLSNGRDGALPVLVLMTDGVANWHNGTFDEPGAQQHVLDEAQTCADAKIKIMTISLGANADSALMQQVADITGGKHFNIPGGQSPSAYKAALVDVFEEIADARPLQLVK